MLLIFLRLVKDLIGNGFVGILQKTNTMKLMALFALSLLLVQCKNVKMNTVETEKSVFYVGTYTDKESKGIYQYELSGNGELSDKRLVAETSSPSFLAISADKKSLLAVNEVNSGANQSGTIESYQIDESDSLIFVNSSLTGGAHPCYVALNENGVVLVSNYTGGNVGLLNLKENGALTELLDVVQHEGSGSTDRQEAPHAHSIRFEPESNNIVSVDLGTNELWFSKLNANNKKFESSDVPKLAMAEGAGPRHITFHPNNKWLYVLNELNATVTQVVKTDDGKYELGQTIPTLPSDFEGFNLCADIHISSDGKFLYASNRGHHSIVIYKVNSETGTLTLVGHESTRGEWPRNFTLSPDEKFVIVANQNSNNMVCFSRDEQTGLLTYVQEVEAFSPVCILFK